MSHEIRLHCWNSIAHALLLMLGQGFPLYPNLQRPTQSQDLIDYVSESDGQTDGGQTDNTDGENTVRVRLRPANFRRGQTLER